MSFNKVNRRNRIKKRIRKIVIGTEKKPRLSVFRSNKEIYSQLINDSNGETLVSASSIEKEVKKNKIKKIEKSSLIGEILAKRAKEKNINQIKTDGKIIT